MQTSTKLQPQALTLNGMEKLKAGLDAIRNNLDASFGKMMRNIYFPNCKCHWRYDQLMICKDCREKAKAELNNLEGL